MAGGEAVAAQGGVTFGQPAVQIGFGGRVGAGQNLFQHRERVVVPAAADVNGGAGVDERQRVGLGLKREFGQSLGTLELRRVGFKQRPGEVVGERGRLGIDLVGATA